ncbi:MAG: hypothetical protein OHK0024_33540 [Thalassobaculales bacterium]
MRSEQNLASSRQPLQPMRQHTSSGSEMLTASAQRSLRDEMSEALDSARKAFRKTEKAAWLLYR